MLPNVPIHIKPPHTPPPPPYGEGVGICWDLFAFACVIFDPRGGNRGGGHQDAWEKWLLVSVLI